MGKRVGGDAGFSDVLWRDSKLGGSIQLWTAQVAAAPRVTIAMHILGTTPQWLQTRLVVPSSRGREGVIRRSARGAWAVRGPFCHSAWAVLSSTDKINGHG